MQNKNNNSNKKTNTISYINNMDMKINTNDFKIHPIYAKYGSDKEGNIINLSKNKLVNNRVHFNGYKCFII